MRRSRITLDAVRDPTGEQPWMPGYGVGQSPWTPLPWSWAEDRLASNRNFWVVTVSAQGRPHAMPVWGVWDDDEHRFAFSCGPRSRKAADLAANPQTSFMIDDTVECLSVEGRAGHVEDDERRDIWIGRYLAKYQAITPELSADFLRAHLLFEVVPDRAFAVIEREAEFAARATKWTFDHDG